MNMETQPTKKGLRENEISKEDPEEVFEMLDIIGEGAYGLICTCRNIKQNKIYAIKFLEVGEDAEANIQNELDILKEANKSDNIVKYYGCFMKEATLMIVMEFCDGGSVLDMMNATKKTLSEDLIAAIAYNMLQGLDFLHSLKIIHRDLKAGNVLINKNGVAKLADFGVSAKLTHTLQRRKTVVGSPYWMAPEVISVQKEKGNGYGNPADIWSLAISLIEFAEGKPPLFDIPPLRVIFIIPTRDPPTLKDPKAWSPEFVDFLSTCLRKDPSKRPSAKELLGHPFILKGAKNSVNIIQEWVTSVLPALTEYRAKKKQEREQEEDDEDPDDSNAGQRSTSKMSGGSILKVNTQTRSFSVGTDEPRYGTTLINTNEEEKEPELEYND